MVKHIVMWKFKDEAEGLTREENLMKVKAMLEALPEKIDFIRHIEVNLNANFNGSNFDAVLISEFDSIEDVNCYRVHPDHKKISAYVSLVREARASVDYIC